MTHSYDFVLFKTPTYTDCLITYTGDTIIPNQILKDIAASIIEKATLIWLKGNDSCINESINMAAYKSLLVNDGNTVLLQWLRPFNNLDMDNRYSDITMSGYRLRLY